MITATRYHDISCGHRVVGHEGKCRHLHGHNYRIHFTCRAPQLDDKGRVIDFSVIKERLCMWIENAWDHKFLAWDEDPVVKGIFALTRSSVLGFFSDLEADDKEVLQESIVWLPFNPTAENLANYLLTWVGPRMLQGTGVTLQEVIIEETRKCSVSAITT